MDWPQTISSFIPRPDPRPVREVEQEILDELESHIEMRALDNVATGMSADDARQNALHRFGGFAGIHKACRQTLLGERIMWQRIQAVLTLVMLGALLFLGVEFYRGQQANEAATARMMQVLDNLVGPSVVQTMPKSGDANVDPSLTEIRVAYNKEMMDGSWSWSQISNETFPKAAGKPRYEADGKTCVLPVQLAPGKTYVLWLNSQKFGNFKDAKGRPAVPYLLVFETTKE
jgi:RNA polymerase sigma-70 factor (ECF subfamily)